MDLRAVGRAFGGGRALIFRCSGGGMAGRKGDDGDGGWRRLNSFFELFFGGSFHNANFFFTIFFTGWVTFGNTLKRLMQVGKVI